MRLPSTVRAAEVLAKDAEGKPVATRHRYGKGRAIYLGTVLALGYHRHFDPQAGDWIAAAARRYAGEASVSASAGAPRVFFRGLKCPERLAAILTNPGAAREIEEVLTARRYQARGTNWANEIEVPVRGGVSVVQARTRTR